MKSIFKCETEDNNKDDDKNNNNSSGKRQKLYIFYPLFYLLNFEHYNV